MINELETGDPLYAWRRPEPPEAKPTMGFFTDATICIGCKACEVACKQWNGLPADGFDWTGNSYDNTSHLSSTTWRHVAFVEQGSGATGTAAEGGIGSWLMVSDVCKHCAAAPCQEACPTGALIYNEFGNVYVQDDICNGCGYCVTACPFGVVARNPDDGGAHKCTLCYDRQRDGMTPACAQSCPTGSIQFGPVEELRERARDRVEQLHERGEHRAYLYGADEAGEYQPLNAFFLLTEQPAAYNLPDAPRRPSVRMKRNYLVSVGAGIALAALAALGFARERRER